MLVSTLLLAAIISFSTGQHLAPVVTVLVHHHCGLLVGEPQTLSHSTHFYQNTSIATTQNSWSRSQITSGNIVGNDNPLWTTTTTDGHLATKTITLISPTRTTSLTNRNSEQASISLFSTEPELRTSSVTAVSITSHPVPDVSLTTGTSTSETSSPTSSILNSHISNILPSSGSTRNQQSSTPVSIRLIPAESTTSLIEVANSVTSTSFSINSSTQRTTYSPPTLGLQSDTTSTAIPIATATCLPAPAIDVTCPASDGTLFTPEGECSNTDNSYIISCGAILPSDNLVIVVGVPDVETCISQCNNDNSCVAGAFDTSSGVCYEKSSVVFGNVIAVTRTIIFAFSVRYALSVGAFLPPVFTSTTNTMSSTTTSISLWDWSSTALSTTATPSPSTTTEPSCTSQPIFGACPTCSGEELIVPDGTVWQIDCETVYGGLVMGASLLQKRQSDPDSCLASCEANTSCSGFSWYVGQCILFSRIPAIVSVLDGAISARKSKVLVFSPGSSG